MPCCCSQLQREGLPASPVLRTASLWLLDALQEAANPALHGRMPQPQGCSTLQVHIPKRIVKVQFKLYRRSLSVHFRAPTEHNNHRGT